MKKYYSLALIVVSFNLLFGQQESQFANLVNNPYFFNPAAGGMYDLVQLDLGYRNQWLAASGNPTSFYLSGHSQIKFGKGGDKVLQEFNLSKDNKYEDPIRTVEKLKHVVGGKITSDAIGVFQKTAIYGSYAVHVPIMNQLNVGLGFSGGYSNFGVNSQNTLVLDDNDNAFNQFLATTGQQRNFDLQTGLVVYSERLYVGLSATQLLPRTMTFNNIETGNTLNRHLILMSSYRFPINDEIDLEPFTIIKGTKNSPISVDLGSRVRFNRVAWAGLQYRTSRSFAVSGGLNIMRNFTVAYAFEYGTKKVRISNAGTHEIQLGYLIGNNRNTQKEIKDKDKDVLKKGDEKK
jgi:type IX secretion system PorP/SprF family membrane protein